ncbi:tRNA 2-thiouridine(34) synthase MnmA [Acidobacteriota bacterium]
MSRKKVAVAMSGGVDSSVAAALLKEQEYDVIGLTMNLYPLPKEHCREKNLKSCCGWGSIEDAHRVALTLGIPHFVVNLKELFEKRVILDFCEEYRRGKTPNPCIRCNQYIKFEELLKRAKRLGADYLATGHYARVMYEPGLGRYVLKKGKDKQKDQSYFLYTLTQDQMARTLMPIGFFTKNEVRKKAKEFGLPVAQKPESQEICFVPDNNYAGFLKNKIPEAFLPGDIVDLKDQVLGQHQGILFYTIGQRQGLRIAAPHPLYVLEINAEKNTIVAGTNRQLYKKKLLVSQINMIAKERISLPLAVRTKIRYKHKEAKALLTPLDSKQVQVEFEEAQRAITPGQAAVFYKGNTVVGGGTIDI